MQKKIITIISLLTIALVAATLCGCAGPTPSPGATPGTSATPAASQTPESTVVPGKMTGIVNNLKGNGVADTADVNLTAGIASFQIKLYNPAPNAGYSIVLIPRDPSINLPLETANLHNAAPDKPFEYDTTKTITVPQDGPYYIHVVYDGSWEIIISQ